MFGEIRKSKYTSIIEPSKGPIKNSNIVSTQSASIDNSNNIFINQPYPFKAAL